MAGEFGGSRGSGYGKGNSNIRIDRETGAVSTTNDIRTLMDLLDYIQKRFAVESKSKILHTAQDLFTAKDYYNIFKIGFKDVIGLEFFTLVIVLYPLYLLYKANVFVPFANVDERWIVAVVIYLFTFSIQLSFFLLILFLSYRYYDGVSPRKSIAAYGWGRFTGYIVKILLVLFLFYLVYSVVLENRSIVVTIVYKLADAFHVPPQVVYEKILDIKREMLVDVVKIPAILTFFMVITGFILHQKEKYYQKHLKDKPGKDIGKEKPKPGYIHLGWGYQLYPLNRKLIPIYQSDKSRNYNTAVVGQIGVGKTFVLMHRAKYDIHNGDNVVIIDPKGSGDLLNFVLEEVIKAGRLKDFIYINPVLPELSGRINVLAYYAIPDVIINTVVAGIRTKDEFYMNIAREVTAVIVHSLIEIARARGEHKPEFTFEDIKSYVSAEKLSELKEILQSIETKNAARLINNIDQILATSADHFAKVGGSLRTVLTSLSVGSVGSIIGNVRENDFVRRMIDGKGVILFVESSSLLMRDSSSIIGRVILSNITSLAGLYYAERKKFPRKLKIHCDEFYTQAFIGVENLFDKGREVGIFTDVYFQSLSQLDAELGKDRAKIILENIGSYIVMRVKSPETAERFASIIGEGKDLLTNYHTDGSVTMMERDDWRVMPSEFIRLENREFIFHEGERDYRGFTVDVKQPILEVKMPVIRTEERI